MAATTTKISIPSYLIDFNRSTALTNHDRANFQILRNLLKQSQVCVDADTTQSAQENNTNEQDRHIYQLAAGNFVLAGIVIGFIFSGAIAGAGDKNIRIYLGGVEVLQLDITTGTKTWVVECVVYIKGTATQTVYAKGFASDGTSVANVIETTADLTSQQEVKLTGQSSIASAGSVVTKSAQANVQIKPYVTNV